MMPLLPVTTLHHLNPSDRLRHIGRGPVTFDSPREQQRQSLSLVYKDVADEGVQKATQGVES